MIWSKARFQHSFELLPRVLKEVAPLLLPISLILWSLEFYVSYLNKARFENPYDSSMTTMIYVGLFGVVFQCLASVFSTLYVAKSTQRQMKNGAGESLFPFVQTHFHQSLIEYIRGFISIGIYSLFLIIPGLIRWVQLSFVCLVSSFDPQYLNGEKDALQESKRLVQGALIPLVFLLSLTMLPSMILEESAKGAHTPIAVSFLLYGLSWVIHLYFAIYLSLTFFARWSYCMERP